MARRTRRRARRSASAPSRSYATRRRSRRYGGGGRGMSGLLGGYSVKRGVIALGYGAGRQTLNNFTSRWSNRIPGVGRNADEVGLGIAGWALMKFTKDPTLREAGDVMLTCELQNIGRNHSFGAGGGGAGGTVEI